MECLDERAYQIGGEGRGDGHSQRASAQVAHVMNGALALLQFLMRPLRITQIDLPGIGQPRRAA